MVYKCSFFCLGREQTKRVAPTSRAWKRARLELVLEKPMPLAPRKAQRRRRREKQVVIVVVGNGHAEKRVPQPKRNPAARGARRVRRHRQILKEELNGRPVGVQDVDHRADVFFVHRRRLEFVQVGNARRRPVEREIVYGQRLRPAQLGERARGHRGARPFLWLGTGIG